MKAKILENYIAHLSAFSGAAGSRGLKYLNEVNDFPYFSVVCPGETRIHYGGGAKLKKLSISIRGYSWSDDPAVHETFARTLEVASMSFSKAYASVVDSGAITLSDGSTFTIYPGFALPAATVYGSVHECKVITLETDEGLMEPYGITDLAVELVYEA